MERNMNMPAVGTSALHLTRGQLLEFGPRQYTMERYIGQGCFGKVAIWKELHTRKPIAVKIPKTESIEDALRELDMLKAIRALDPDATNIVRCFGSFNLMGTPCLAFEVLDMSLFKLVEQQRGPVTAHDIRPIATQLLVALDALNGIGIMHTDIKPDNVMVVRAWDRPLRIKLIDFGLAMPTSYIEEGVSVQPLGYRAPEVYLGQAYTEAIDMWGLGCVLAFLCLGEELFPWNCEYLQMKGIVELLGQPEDRQLRTGMFTRDFFIEEDQETEKPRFRLMTAEEFSVVNRVSVEDCETFLPSSLDGFLHMYPLRDATNLEDTKALLDLLKELLNMDGGQRITPREALQHHFLSSSDQSHIPDDLDGSQAFVSVAPLANPAPSLSPSGTSSTSLDLAIELGELFETPRSPSGVSVKSQDSVMGLGDLFQTPCCPPSVTSQDSVMGLKNLFETPKTSPVVTVACLESAHGLAEPGSSDSAASCVQQDGAGSLSQVEVPCSGELPSAAPTGRVQRTLKRISRFFRRVHKTFCCCTWSPTDDGM